MCYLIFTFGTKKYFSNAIHYLNKPLWISNSGNNNLHIHPLTVTPQPYWIGKNPALIYQLMVDTFIGLEPTNMQLYTVSLLSTNNCKWIQNKKSSYYNQNRSLFSYHFTQVSIWPTSYGTSWIITESSHFIGYPPPTHTHTHTHTHTLHLNFSSVHFNSTLANVYFFSV